MSHLHKAYDMLDRELEDMVEDGKIEKEEDIHLMKEITGGMKNILTIIAMNESGTERRRSRREW